MINKEIIFIVEEYPEGGYGASALGHPIITEAESWDRLRENVRDAVKCHFEEAERPKIIHLHEVREERLAV